MKVRLYPESQRKPQVMDIDDTKQLAELQKLVGGYVEPVHTQRLVIAHNVALVDEDGRTKGARPNYRATLELGYAGILYGSVVVCGEAMGDEGMEWVNVHE